MLTKVLRVDVEAPYKLRLEFSDGTSGVYDCAPIVDSPGSMVQPLKDPKYFARVFVEMGAPTWPNGFDLAPWAIQKELADAGKITCASFATTKREAGSGKFMDTKSSSKGVGKERKGVRKVK
jgi:hypothetical protein